MTRLSICWRVDESRQKRDVADLGGALGDEDPGGALGEDDLGEALGEDDPGRALGDEDLGGHFGDEGLGGRGGAVWDEGRSMSRSDTPGWWEFITNYHYHYHQGSDTPGWKRVYHPFLQ